MIGLAPRARKFSLRGASGRVYSQSREEATQVRGCARSQSLEESGRTAREVLKLIRTNSNYRHLVFAARPAHEKRSFLRLLKSGLTAAGFRVFVVRVVAKQPERFYAERGREILRHLSA